MTSCMGTATLVSTAQQREGLSNQLFDRGGVGPGAQARNGPVRLGQLEAHAGQRAAEALLALAPAPRRGRRDGGSPRRAGEDQRQLVTELEEEALGDLLPDAGDALQRGQILPRDGARELRRRQRPEDGDG